MYDDYVSEPYLDTCLPSGHCYISMEKGHDRSTSWRALLVVSFSLLILAASHALEVPVISPSGGKVQVPVLVSMTHANPSGVIFYTTDGTDPRDGQGRVRQSARVYRPSFRQESFGGPLSVNGSTTIHARVKSGIDWSELAVTAFVGDQDFSYFLITEIMYHPTAVKGTPRNEEFLELKNLGDTPLDLSGLRIVDFTEGMEELYVIYTFPEGTTAPPGGYLILVANPESFRSIYPGVPFDGVIPPGKIRVSPFNNQVGRIALVGADGSVATQMRYQSHAPWPVVPDNHGYFRDHSSPVGFSLTRTSLDPKADPEHFSTWRASSARMGSPGEDDLEPKIPRLLINELRTRSGGALLDAVEIHNPTSKEVAIGGWWLSDARNDPFKFQFSWEMVVPAKGYLVVNELDFAAAGSDLVFSSGNDRCYLFSGGSEGELTGYSDGFQFLGSDRNYSFGRVESSDGNDYFLIEESSSFGLENMGPTLPDLMITEIMSHPGPGGFPYLELENITLKPIRLWDPDYPQNAWSLTVATRKEGRYQFPKYTTVPSGGFVLIVPEGVDPGDLPKGVQVFSFPDFLSSESPGVISLYRPSGMTGDKPRRVIVDQARYQDFSPWNSGAAGGGQGLERIGISAFGSDPSSWRAGPVGGTPGAFWQAGSPVAVVPEIFVTTRPGFHELQFFAEFGYQYLLEESFDLEDWSASSVDPIIGDGSESSFVVEAVDTSSPRYFRLVVDAHPPY
jgi:hypothetical protein